jgi:hypothetical protein
MNCMSRATLSFLITASFALVSCATLRTAGGNSVSTIKGSASVAMSKMSDLPFVHLLPGQGPKVVEVREKDLKEMPSGLELAQTRKKRRSGFWIFGGPVDFTEPTLPEPGAEPDGSLLPPRMP